MIKEYSFLNTNDSQEKLSKAKQLLQEEYDIIEAEISFKITQSERIQTWEIYDLTHSSSQTLNH